MSLIASVRSEITKLFSTSAWWILAVILVVYVGGLAAGMSGLFSWLATGGDTGGAGALPVESLPATMYSIATSVGYPFPLLVGTLMVTAEFRHKTLTPTFLATPKRGIALAAKVVVAVLVGVLYGVIAVIAVTGSAAAILAASGLDTTLGDSDTWAMRGRQLIGFVLWTVIGVGLGALIRNQVAAIVIVLAFTQFVEPVLRIAGGFIDWIGSVTNYLPGAASDALVGASFYSGLGGMPASASGLEWWAGGLVLAGYAVVFLVLGALTSWRRDLT